MSDVTAEGRMRDLLAQIAAETAEHAPERAAGQLLTELYDVRANRMHVVAVQGLRDVDAFRAATEAIWWPQFHVRPIEGGIAIAYSEGARDGVPVPDEAAAAQACTIYWDVGRTPGESVAKIVAYRLRQHAPELNIEVREETWQITGDEHDQWWARWNRYYTEQQ